MDRSTGADTSPFHKATFLLDLISTEAHKSYSSDALTSIRSQARVRRTPSALLIYVISGIHICLLSFLLGAGPKTGCVRLS